MDKASAVVASLHSVILKHAGGKVPKPFEQTLRNNEDLHIHAIPIFIICVSALVDSSLDM